MNSYTDTLEAGAAELYEYEALEKLPGIIASFRGHGAALGEFLNTHGYPENAEDSVSAKAAFLKQRFEAAGIGAAKARGAEKWLTEMNGFERETGFRIAFALGLDIDGTNDFFRTVLLDRGFDCHTIEEAIYYYCIFNRRGWKTAESLIGEAPVPGKIPAPSDGTVLYTKNIISFIRSCPDDQALIRYFKENITQFGYNQVKAREFIKSLWESIAAPGGLADREWKILLNESGRDRTGLKDSTWEIYLQILGLDTDDAKAIETDRTIKPILENQMFMHEFAAANFPNRQSIEKILRGGSTRHDLIRKTLILLAFYKYWAQRALSRHSSPSYEAEPYDRDRCLAELDQYLLDAGFPEMYAGNPFDWIFLWAAGRAAPLLAFRSYWQLLSAEFNDKNKTPAS